MEYSRSTISFAASLPILELLAYNSAARTNAAAIDTDQERMMKDTLAPGESLWIEKLTYIDVRDLSTAGYTTAIIPTGGIEENGPCIPSLNSQA